jgi:uncharacterized hydrophobic protein (TIGR00271 family)
MTRWGVRIARAMGKPLHILWVESGSAQPEDDLNWLPWSTGLANEESCWQSIASELSDVEELDVQVCQAACQSRCLTVLTAERKLSPSLIVVGRHDSSKDGSMTGKLARQLFDEAQSTVLVLRLGSFSCEDDSNPAILVPCAGGRHSRRGMKLAAQMAGKDATALFVESDFSDISLEVGQESLRRSLKRAGVSPDDVTPKVELSNHVADAINEELHHGDYGLMLIGAAGGGTLREKLFGTVPERLLRRDVGMSIGVIRASRPAGARMRERLGRMMSLTIPQLKREERIQLFAEMEGQTRWSFDFAVLMVLSTAIAGLGLLANSGAVVIGAMLVAPLMNPLLGGGLALVQGNWPLWKQCQKSVLLGFLSALTVGVLLGCVARVMGLTVTGELLARGEPTLLDLGVAFISGLAASYCLARPRLSGALAGVAIAAALVPPIATTGICFAMGVFDISKGAALLFGTNVVAIVFGSSLNFLIAGVKAKQTVPRLWARRLSIVFALICAGLSVPLASVLLSKASRKVPVEESMAQALSDSRYRLVRMQMTRGESGGRQLDLHLEGPGFPNDEITGELQRLAAERYGNDIKLRVHIDLVCVLSSSEND